MLDNRPESLALDVDTRSRRTSSLAPPAARALLLVALLLPFIPEGPGPRGWREGFDNGRLDPGRWVATAEGDFKERTVDVVDVSRRGARDLRLRLRADTRGTRDDTVKYLGVRTVRRISIGEGTRIGVTLDWNEQANGSYFSAALVLTPETTDGSPLRAQDWLKVEYVGVPPGRNARLAVEARTGGRERTLFTEGWPETNRTGRKIGVQDVLLVFARSSFEIHENGRRVFESKGAVSFDAAYLHLQLSSHSNYPPREIFFDDVYVTVPAGSGAAAMPSRAGARGAEAGGTTVTGGVSKPARGGGRWIESECSPRPSPARHTPWSPGS
jgi:hypothetical protein